MSNKEKAGDRVGRGGKEAILDWAFKEGSLRN